MIWKSGGKKEGDDPEFIMLRIKNLNLGMIVVTERSGCVTVNILIRLH